MRPLQADSAFKWANRHERTLGRWWKAGPPFHAQDWAGQKMVRAEPAPTLKAEQGARQKLTAGRAAQAC